MHFATLTFNQGSRIIVVANKTSQSLQPSTFESPLFERSYKGHSVCVRFRYIMYGFGRRVLRLYQQLESITKTKRLMWAVNESNNTEGTWKYGRVSLPSVTKHRVSTIPQVSLNYIQFTKHNETIQECIQYNFSQEVWFRQMQCLCQSAPLRESRVIIRDGPQKNEKRANLALSFCKTAGLTQA